MNLFAISGLFVFISNLFSALIFLPYSKGNTCARLYAVYCFIASIWGISSFFIAISVVKESALLWWQIGYFAVIFCPILYLHIISVHIKNLKKLFLVKSLYLIGAGIFVYEILFPKLFFGDLVKMFDQYFQILFFNQHNLLWISFYLSFWWIVISYGLVIFYNNFKQMDGPQKVSAKYFIIGSIVGWLGGHFQFPAYFNIKLYPISNFLIGIYPLIMGYGIIRYQMLDIKIALQKGLVYSILVALITGGYSILVSTAGNLFQGMTNSQSFLLNTVFIFFVALLFNPVREWIQHILDKKFFHGTLESLERESQRLQQELFQKEKLAYVGQLASSVVHEIRNPLATIKTYLEYLPKKYDQADFKAKFERLIPQEINRVEKIVNQLLGLARQRKLNLQPLDINALIDNTLELLENNFRTKNIHIDKEYEPGAIITGDEELLKQVFLNLFLNATQAMDEEGVLTIKVGIDKEGLKDFGIKGFKGNTKDGSNGVESNPQFLKSSNPQILKSSNPYVVITITDTGCGIPPEQLNKLFTPFQTTKEDGIGLGLSITKEIIEQHHGSIQVESREGEGTIFIIALPKGPNG